MSERTATAGFRNAGWTMDALPSNVRVSVHPVATHDGAAVTGILYAGGDSDIAFCIMHPREFMASHYLVPALTSAGYAVWTQTSRAVGQDLRLEHECTLLDAAAGIGFLRALGFLRIVLIGNSGGASLYGFYNQQSLLDGPARLNRTPGGRPVVLASADMPVADGIVFVSPHPGQGLVLMRSIDPAVVDEADPLKTDPRLDFLNPDNGFRPGARGSAYSSEFVERYGLAQRARVKRLDEIARAIIDRRLAAKGRARSGGTAKDARMGSFSAIMTVWRTDADLRCWDPSLDASDRQLGSVWGNDPTAVNYGVPGFGRLCTPEAWLSTWSGITSRANLIETAASIAQPCLQIEYTGDNVVFPSDGNAVFAAISSAQKRRLYFRGDHHGRALVDGERAGRQDAADAIVTWARETFR
jgi:hypothetical protein